jgi:hypothetical protein
MSPSAVARPVNLALLGIFPVAWAAPLLETGLMPEFRMPGWLGGSTLFAPDTITVLSGIAKLWQTDALMALVVIAFALVAPLLKCAGLALLHAGRLPPALHPALGVMGKLAMADIFLVALYIVIAKGIGVGQVQPGWGLYLFTGAVIASLAVSLVPPDRVSRSPE